MVKIHVDIIEDFTLDFATKLKQICEDNNILILEDRKFADIGHIFKKQFTGGIYKILNWCHLITMHALVGAGPIRCFQEYADLNRQGVLLIKEMSNKGNMLDKLYADKCVALAQKHPEVVWDLSGKVVLLIQICYVSCLVLTEWLHKIKRTSDIKPLHKPIKDGADIIIVGRGIVTEAHNISIEAEIYRTFWGEYKK